MTLIKKATTAYLAGGLSIIPINRKTKRPAWWLFPQKRNAAGDLLFSRKLGNGAYVETTEDTGAPKGTWEPYQHTPPTIDEVGRWLRAGIQSIAIVGGKVSGGVEVLDFDNHSGVTWFAEWCALAGEPIEKCGLAVQRTGGGGFQVGWRCDVVEGNQKLAWAPAPDEVSGKKVMIETRGEGGYFLVAPSAHPSGNHYQRLQGRFSQLPTIDPDLRSLFLDCARRLNQVEIAERSSGGNTQYTASGAGEVAEAYNKAHPIEETLRKYGYTDHGNRWSRPGKADSMGLVVFDDGKAYAFSSNDVMNSDRLGMDKRQPFSSFDLFAYYDHSEDYGAATLAAAKELGLHTELHTLLFVEDYDNAAAARELMFKQGWVVRGFKPDKINLEGINKYSNVIVWSYKDSLAKHVANMIPGAYPLVVPKGLDAQAMAKEGILQPYLEAVLADARANVKPTIDYGDLTAWVGQTVSTNFWTELQAECRRRYADTYAFLSTQVGENWRVTGLTTKAATP